MMNELSRIMVNIFEGGSPLMIALAVVMAVYYVVLCFFGYKIRKVFGSVAGCLVGLVIGILFAWLCFSESEYMWIIAVVAALAAGAALAVAAWKLYNVGVFLFAMCTAYGVVYNLAGHLLGDHVRFTFGGLLSAAATAPEHFSRMAMGIAIVAALLFAALAVRFVRPLLILSTASHGGVSLAIVLSVLVHRPGSLLLVAGAGLVLFLLGLVVQIRTTQGQKQSGQS